MHIEKLDEGIKARADEVEQRIEERARLDREVRENTAAQLAALLETFEQQKLPVLEHPPASAMVFSKEFLKETGYQDAEVEERKRIIKGMGAESMQHFDALTLRETPPTNDRTELV